MGASESNRRAVNIRISAELDEAIKAIAENQGRTKKATAEWLIQKGVKWYDQSHDKQLKEINEVWERLTGEAQMYLVAVANSFLKVAPISRVSRKFEREINEKRKQK